MASPGQSDPSPDFWHQPFHPILLVMGWAVITAVLSVLFFNRLDESRARVTGTHEVLISLEKALAAAVDAETAQRGYLITHENSYFASYQSALVETSRHLQRLSSLEIGNSAQLKRLGTLKTLWVRKAAELGSLIDIAHDKGWAAAHALVAEGRGERLMGQMRKVGEELEVEEMQIRADALVQQNSEAHRVFLFTQLTTIAGFCGLLYLLANARSLAEAFREEVSNRQSAVELAEERAALALRMRVMNRELVHRTKNLISVVQAIARNQDKGSPEIDRYVAGLSSRLVSLGATMDILVREDWHQVLLDDLIGGQLGHFSQDIFQRIIISPGPPIKFTASEAQMLGLALHELGTNAAKYGALSVQDGTVDIRWSEDHADSEPVIKLSWTEKNGPPVTAPSRRGFGSRLTETLVARAVGGTAVTQYEPSGLTWTLTFPRDRISQDHESAAPANAAVIV